ncbi:MAG: glycosyltransferase family 2 protein [Prevotella sp.]|nr:glycosyltransferase family 2 protein [Prevotella sp.]
MKKLTIVIVSYNVRYYLEQCIVSVQRAARDIDYEIYVVDNASSDDSTSYLRHRFGDDITLVESQHNEGFARANNIATRQSQSEYVLLLNPDTFIAEDCLLQVLTFMDEHPKAGGVGVKMHNADGTVARESRRGLPTPWVSLLKMVGFSRRYYMSNLPWDEPGRIEVMSGAFCMLRRQALDQVGLLDEDFFMYGEDIDLSYRILKGGFENWFVPANIVHYKGESTQKSSYRYVHVFYQAMLIFFRKHYGHLSLFVTLPIKLAIYVRAAIALVQMQYWRMRKSLGFEGKEHADTNYCFVGSAVMLDECRSLARRKGLSAQFVEAQRLAELPLNTPVTCMVYDTDQFSFSQIISHAAASPVHVHIGTYSCTSKVLITPSEVIR